MDKKTINAKFKELAELKIMQAELEAEMETLKDELKTYMADNNLEELIGDEHKATWKEVTKNIFDSKAFRKLHADMYEAFKKPSVSKPFTFA